MKTKVKVEFYTHFDLLYMQFSKAKIDKTESWPVLLLPLTQLKRLFELILTFTSKMIP